jgi:hypothetical protein
MWQDCPAALAPGGDAAARVITAAEFRELIISHRRMVRADQRADSLRGLKDLDTGEVFLTDERRLLELRPLQPAY